MDDVLEGFEELFRGNGTAHGLVHGECVRTPPTTELWEDHLYGLGSLGIYPTVRLVQGTIDGVQLVCRWGCSDIDTHGPRGFSQEDARVHAKNVVTALDVLGHRGWVERTKSEGYHVWLFAESWVDARVMRSVLLLAHQLADVPAYEVNPKDALGATELGNYVNICYPWREPSETFAALDTGEPSLGSWDHRGGGNDPLAPQGGSSNPGGDTSVHDGSGRDRATPQPRWSGALTPPDPSSVHGRTPQGPMGVGSPKHCGRCGSAVRHPAVVGLPTYEHSSYRPRRVVIDPLRPDSPLCVGCFVESAHRLRSSVAQLHETAGLYVPPAPPAPVTKVCQCDAPESFTAGAQRGRCTACKGLVMRPFSGLTEAPQGGRYDHSKDITDEELRHAVEQLNGKGFVIWRDGPNQGGRALTMFRLGVECRESGLTPDEAMTVLVDWDWRYGKFLSGVDGHTNGIRYIEDAVRKIYG